ncbi:GntP family permease [Faecalicatena contorta]|uniref:GntP family permease n=1 Tax=Faecalicatena fissicatena TaxID=290055 RepID=A0ABS2ECI9_9FIRM|nr:MULTISPECIES: gluconate:H+ symporter [Faecalicatena]MBM6684883.1 GntP family permease [Faecalicatena contorta]MBM6710411.1 GntP family permease [Faecalicatena contorta]MBM6739351.1 GntP family permease [Faecalicatena fissicatena]
MSLGLLIVVFLIALIFVLVSIIKFDLHPFLALLIGGLLMGILSGMSLTDIATGLANGFGSTMTSIGILIILGVALGNLLHLSGCTSQIAALMLKMTGQKRAGLAVNLTGYIVSIPVFFDAAFVILVNLVKSLSRKGKIPFVSLVCALAVGLITTHALVIPTPGPVAVAGTMGANMGWFLLYSIIVSLPAAIIGGVVYGKFLGKSDKYANDFANAFDDVDEETEITSDKNLPSGGLGIFLIFLPIVIILLGTIMTMFLEEGTMAYIFFAFLGDKNMALLIGVLVAFFALKKYIKESFNEIVTDATTQSGAILAITGAGGAFGAIINATGIGDKLVAGMTGLTEGAGIAMIIAAFVISQVLRAAQGSTTVALVTTSAIFSPIVAGMAGASPVLVGLAICAGGVGLSLPNDSGFWVVNRFSKFDVKQTMKVWTVGGTISGVTALVIVIVLSLFSSVLPGLM